MLKEELEAKLNDVIKDWEQKAGKVTDIWLSAELLDILDTRGPMARVLEPYKIQDTFVTSSQELQGNNIRIAFLSELI